MGVLGKPWQCDALIDGIYQCLQPHHLTLPELSVLLMSIHIESVQRVRPRKTYKKALMRYIVEEESPALSDIILQISAIMEENA